MRILLLTHFYAPETGPPQLRWDALVRDFRAAGHAVHVLAPAPHYPLGRLLDGEDPDQVGSVQPGRHGESVHRVAFRPGNVTALARLLDQGASAGASVLTAWRRRQEIRADVVVATIPALPTAVAGWLVSRLLRRPYVLEVRDAWPDLLTAKLVRLSARHDLRGLLRRASTRATVPALTWLQRQADLVVTTTDSFARTLRGRGMGRVVTVRNSYHPVPGAGGMTSPPRAGTLRVVYVGTVGRAQGLSTAVRALARLREAGVEASLRVVGTGARLTYVTALAHSLDVPVEFAGRVPREQIHEHYRWADTFLVSLEDWPGMAATVPSKLYEALALGLHVTGVLTGESADIIRSTGAGLVSPPGDHEALARAWAGLAEVDHAPDRSRMAHWVREHASQTAASTTYLHEIESVLLTEEAAR